MVSLPFVEGIPAVDRPNRPPLQAPHYCASLHGHGSAFRKVRIVGSPTPSPVHTAPEVVVTPAPTAPACGLRRRPGPGHRFAVTGTRSALRALGALDAPEW